MHLLRFWAKAAESLHLNLEPHTASLDKSLGLLILQGNKPVRMATQLWQTWFNNLYNFAILSTTIPRP